MNSRDYTPLFYLIAAVVFAVGAGIGSHLHDDVLTVSALVGVGVAMVGALASVLAQPRRHL